MCPVLHPPPRKKGRKVGTCWTGHATIANHNDCWQKKCNHPGTPSYKYLPNTLGDVELSTVLTQNHRYHLISWSQTRSSAVSAVSAVSHHNRWLLPRPRETTRWEPLPRPKPWARLLAGSTRQCNGSHCLSQKLNKIQRILRHKTPLKRCLWAFGRVMTWLSSWVGKKNQQSRIELA